MSLLSRVVDEVPGDGQRSPRADKDTTADASSTTVSGDVVSSLWAELGLAMQPPAPVVPSPAAGAADAASSGSGGIAANAAAATNTAATTTSAATPGTLAVMPDAAFNDVPVTAGAVLPDATVIVADGASAKPASSGDATSTPDLGALAAAFAPASAPIRPAGPVPMSHSLVDIQQPQAPQQVAEAVAWHVGKGVSEVRIQLNPEDLGPLDVQLKIDGDRVSVRFDMADSSVRDVVQTSLPTLASLLSARGLQLDQAQVFSQNRGHANPQQAQTASSFQHHAAGGDAAGDISATPAARVFVRRGLLDDYA